MLNNQYSTPNLLRCQNTKSKMNEVVLTLLFSATEFVNHFFQTFAFE